MGLHRILLSMAAVVILAACGNVSRNYRFDPAGSTGLVVGSVSYESSYGRYILTLESITSSRRFDLGFGCKVVPCLQPANDADFSTGETPEQRGGGFVVEVPEGRYRILGWKVEQGGIVSRSKAPVDIELLVERGKASYVGNLHFDADWIDVRLRDRNVRDIPLLRKKYPVLQATELAYTIAPGLEIEQFGGEYQRRLEQVTIFVPVR